jgi:hypothetical protein
MRLRIAALDLELHDTAAVLADLEALYGEFDARGREYAADARNPHLCRAGCSACCQSGAFFAVSLAEAVWWARGIASLPAAFRARAQQGAARLLDLQHEIFGAGDVPGARDEATFTSRVARVAQRGVSCPLLDADLCSTYPHRPFLCRAYGFPVDAFAVETADAMAFRSLCHLYEGQTLRGWVRAKDLQGQLRRLSQRLADGRDVGRFTSAEAILAELHERSERT